jgi:sugar lactone lactonase YvrE
MFPETRRNFLRKLATTIPFVVSAKAIFSVQRDDPSPPDGAIATKSRLFGPAGLSFDVEGNLYVADELHRRIRRIDANSNVITTIAGTGVQGFSGDGGRAIRAKLDYPSLVHVGRDGHVYFTELVKGRIRKIDAKSRVITTVAGNDVLIWEDHSKEDDLATRRSLEQPRGIASDTHGNLIVSDWRRILKIDKTTQQMATLSDNLLFPSELTTDRNDNIYFAEANTGSIRVLRTDKTLETIYQKRTDGAISNPVLDETGNLYFIESNQIFQMQLSSRRVSHFAGKPHIRPTGNFSGDGGPAALAGMDNPFGLAVDRHGNLFVSDWTANRIRRIDRTTRIIETIAGNGEPKHPPHADL